MLNRLKSTFDDARQAVGAAVGAESDSPGQGSVGRVVQIGAKSYRLTRLLAEGGFSFVYIGEDLASGKQVAVKKLHARDQAALKTVQAEIDLMADLTATQSPYVVRLFGSSTKSTHNRAYEVHVAMELCPGGHFVDIMNQRKANRFSEQELLKIFQQAASGLALLHDKQPAIAHRDLKVENLLLGKDGFYKLCDFGSATSKVYTPRTAAERADVEDDVSRNTTEDYRSPEMIDLFLRQKIDTKVDIWALGCMLYKMAFYKGPFEDQGNLAILNGAYKFPSTSTYSPAFANLIRLMLTPDPEQRPDIHQILAKVSKMTGIPAPPPPDHYTPSPPLPGTGTTQANPTPSQPSQPAAQAQQQQHQGAPQPPPANGGGANLFSLLDWQDGPATSSAQGTAAFAQLGQQQQQHQQAPAPAPQPAPAFAVDFSNAVFAAPPPPATAAAGAPPQVQAPQQGFGFGSDDFGSLSPSTIAAPSPTFNAPPPRGSNNASPAHFDVDFGAMNISSPQPAQRSQPAQSSVFALPTNGVQAKSQFDEGDQGWSDFGFGAGSASGLSGAEDESMGMFGGSAPPSAPSSRPGSAPISDSPPPYSATMSSAPHPVQSGFDDVDNDDGGDPGFARFADDDGDDDDDDDDDEFGGNDGSSRDHPSSSSAHSQQGGGGGGGAFFNNGNNNGGGGSSAGAASALTSGIVSSMNDDGTPKKPVKQRTTLMTLLHNVTTLVRSQDSYDLHLVKATSADPTAPKAKHVRLLIIDSWQTQDAGKFFTHAPKRPIHTTPVVAWKTLVVLHNLIQEGSPAVVEIASSAKQMSWLHRLEDTWRNKASQSSRAGPVKGRAEPLLGEYAAFLQRKLAFNKAHPEFEGMFSLDLLYLKAVQQGVEKPKVGFGSPLSKRVVTELLEFLAAASTIGLKLFAGTGELATDWMRSAVLPLVLDVFAAHQVVVFALSALITAAAKGPSGPEGALGGFSSLLRRYNDGYPRIRDFLWQAESSVFVERFMHVPKVPREAVSFDPPGRSVGAMLPESIHPDVLRETSKNPFALRAWYCVADGFHGADAMEAVQASLSAIEDEDPTSEGSAFPADSSPSLMGTPARRSSGTGSPPLTPSSEAWGTPALSRISGRRGLVLDMSEPDEIALTPPGDRTTASFNNTTNNPASPVAGFSPSSSFADATFFPPSGTSSHLMPPPGSYPSSQSAPSTPAAFAHPRSRNTQQGSDGLIDWSSLG